MKMNSESLSRPIREQLTLYNKLKLLLEEIISGMVTVSICLDFNVTLQPYSISKAEPNWGC